MKQKILLPLALLVLTLLVQQVYGQITGIDAYYSFSGDATDQSGNNNDGQLIGNATANDVLKLGNNTSSYLLLPASVMDGKTDFSISFKIQFKSFHKTGSSPTNHIITGSATSLDRLGLSYERKNLTWRLALNGTTYSFPDLLNVNVWYCVVVTREGNQAKLYVDGLLAGSTTVNTTAIPCTSLLVGQEEDCSGGCFAKNQCTSGKMDDLTFYDHAITSTDVQSICNNASGKDVALEVTPKIPVIYPNPAHDFINISLDASDIQAIEIYNLMGEKVGYYLNSSTINISDLNKGLYFIRVIDLTGTITKTGKFIKE